MGLKFYLMLGSMAGLLALNLTARAAEIAGWVQNEQGLAMETFIVEVNGAPVPGKRGAYKAVVDDDIVVIAVSAEGFFPIIHTFSLLELESRGDDKVVPAITLVERREGRAMLALGGDVMMGRRYQKPRGGEAVLIRPGHAAEDSRAVVRHVKPYFEQADYGLVNLETQVMARAPENSAAKFVTFFSPPETVDALAWAGVDYVTLGNNHTYDNLEEGLVSTLDILAKSPLGYSGAGLNAAQALKPHRTRIADVPYSFLGYVGWKGGSTPHQAAEGTDKGGAALGTMDNILKSVAPEVAAGQTTVVQLHASMEYAEEPTLSTEQRLKSAIDEGADLAIAHHPHVVQGFEIYKERLIAYSLGNFIFDQYFYAPQLSYMLYVWMDGETFHRAEIVPLYIKGYKPTPAMGQMRSAVLKRTATLSAGRNVALSHSGGHGVITARPVLQRTMEKAPLDLTLPAGGHRLISLGRCDATHYVTGLDASRKNIQYRLGRDMLHRGDFEHFNSFDAPERGWIPQNAASGPDHSRVYGGRTSFRAVAVPGASSSLFGMKVFARVYRESNPVTFTGQVFSAGDVTLDFYMQGRPSRGGLQDSLDNAPRQHLGRMSLKGDAWREFAFDFDSPRVGYRSFRVLVEATARDGRAVAPVYYDDIALVEWQTAYRETGDAAVLPAPNRITHVGLRGEVTAGDDLRIRFESHDPVPGRAIEKCRFAF